MCQDQAALLAFFKFDATFYNNVAPFSKGMAKEGKGKEPMPQALVSQSFHPDRETFIMPEPGQNSAKAGSLKGKTFCLTGIFPEVGGGQGLNLGKDKVTQIITKFGGKVTSAISGVCRLACFRTLEPCSSFVTPLGTGARRCGSKGMGAREKIGADAGAAILVHSITRTAYANSPSNLRRIFMRTGKTDVLIVGKEAGFSKVTKARGIPRIKLMSIKDLKLHLESGLRYAIGHFCNVTALF